MSEHKATMLGTGLIGLFYTRTLHAQRNRDRVHVVYSRSEERARAFAEAEGVPEWTTDLEAAIAHAATDTVIVGLPNDLHEDVIRLAADAGKAVLCTKPLARTGAEAKRILDIVEGAGVFGGYLEDLAYTPKTLKALGLVAERRDRRRARGRARARRTPARTARGSGTRRRRAAGRSSTSAATASRSSATSSARATGRSR